MTTPSLEDQLAEAVQARDNAYRERNQLVAFVSRLYPAHLCRHPAEDLSWEMDWRWIVCIHSPSGQLTWHMHDSELVKFNHLEINDHHWDGHTADEKYQRLQALPLTTLALPSRESENDHEAGAKEQAG